MRPDGVGHVIGRDMGIVFLRQSREPCIISLTRLLKRSARPRPWPDAYQASAQTAIPAVTSSRVARLLIRRKFGITAAATASTAMFADAERTAARSLFWG